MDRLKDKVTIVTGSTSGIGKGIAKVFAAEGAKVVVCGRREERGTAIVGEIEAAGGTAMFHFLDVTKPETVDALFVDTEAAWGKIDAIVNNAAGMALKDGRVDEISLEDWDAVFASDIRSTFYCIKTALPYLKRNGGGSIVNIGSMAACGGDLGSTAYACAKVGVDNTPPSSMARRTSAATACARASLSPRRTPRGSPMHSRTSSWTTSRSRVMGLPRTLRRCASTLHRMRASTSRGRSSPLTVV